MSAALFVTYPKAAGERFDRDYYVGTHLPLVETPWRRYGLTSAQAYFPATTDATEVAVALLTFDEEGSIGLALASAETPAVLADVPNFTDISPVLARGIAP